MRCIQSGTGKTVTGVHIAYWFAERNRASKSYKIWEKGQGQTEESPKAPPQVIYCGPSNKAVDVVTGKLCFFSLLLKGESITVLRMFWPLRMSPFISQSEAYV